MTEQTTARTLTADIEATTQEQMNAYGAVAGTYGKIHTDPEWAKGQPVGGVIVQGMLVLAPLHEAMVQLYGAERWLSGGRFESKIIGMSRPGEARRLRLTFADGPDDAGTFAIERDDGAPVIVGTFAVPG